MPNPLIDPNIERAETLPSRFYMDPIIFETSKEKLFTRFWQFVGDTDLVKVPGQCHPFTLLEGCLDEPLLITRDSNDQLHCLSNVCTHRGNLVCEAGGNEKFLRCRYHGRRFHLDGTMHSMPEMDDAANFPRSEDNLANVPFGQWNKFLFAAVDPICPLEEYLYPLERRIGWLPLNEFYLEPNRSRDYMVRANWALYVDNYLEGFHIPFIHAALNQELVYEDYGTELFKYSILQLGVAKGNEGCFDLPRGSLDYGKNISAYYFWLFPNLMLNFYAWGLSVNIIKPLAPDLTRVSFLCYLWDASKLGQGAGAELDRVEREDESVVESCQKGVRSRFYDRGRFSPKREIGTHHFHRLLAESLS